MGVIGGVKESVNRESQEVSVVKESVNRGIAGSYCNGGKCEWGSRVSSAAV